VAACIGASPKEITFTSGGSEADNQAIRSAALLGARRGKRHIISTAFEHHAVLHTLKRLEDEGFEVELLPVGPLGTVTAHQVAEAIREDTALVSVMLVNNEVGTIQPVRELTSGGRVHEGVTRLLHVDAVQAVGHIPVDVKALGADMLSISGHKFGGPKGVGALYISRRLNRNFVAPLIYGGGQERGVRSGTENVLGIAAMGEAVQWAAEHLEEHRYSIQPLRDKLIDGITAIRGVEATGSLTNRVPGIASFVIGGIEGLSCRSGR